MKIRKHRNASINEGVSPMAFIEETLDDKQEDINYRRKKIKEEQNIKPPLLIGSIETINKRICELDGELQSFVRLVVDSDAGGGACRGRRGLAHEDIDTATTTTTTGLADDLTDIVAHSDQAKEQFKIKQLENKEMKTFAGVYSIKSTFFGKPTDRNLKKEVCNKKEVIDTGKPKFIELHQYPGFDNQQLTPLPNGFTAIEILQLVANAQRKKRIYIKKYQIVFDKLFYSPMSQAILLDIFWWVFLHHWQPSNTAQQLIFNRVAFNYVKLLSIPVDPRHRSTFLRSYGEFLSQSIFCSFCETFPDSIRQFNESFKDDLVSLVFKWISGIAPTPRFWLNWPKIVSKQSINKEISPNENKQETSIMSFLDVIETARDGQKRVFQSSRIAGSVCSLYSSGANTVKEKKRRFSRIQMNIKNSSDRSSFLNKDVKHPPKEVSIQETANISPDTTDTPIVMPQQKVHMSKKQSTPVGRDATFKKVVFNTNGNAPLVGHYLRVIGKANDTGPINQMQYTTITELPALDAYTYRDLISDAYKTSRQMDATVHRNYEKNQILQAKFHNKQREDRILIEKKQKLLLSKQLEVKQLADLIMLGQKTDKDSFAGKANSAILSALHNQEI